MLVSIGWYLRVYIYDMLLIRRIYRCRMPIKIVAFWSHINIMRWKNSTYYSVDSIRISFECSSYVGSCTTFLKKMFKTAILINVLTTSFLSCSDFFNYLKLTLAYLRCLIFELIPFLNSVKSLGIWLYLYCTAALSFCFTFNRKFPVAFVILLNTSQRD